MKKFYESFEGEYRRKPEVSMRGASKKVTKEELLIRTAAERQNRETHRLKIASCVKIQSLFRGFATRRRQRDRLRTEFEAQQQRASFSLGAAAGSAAAAGAAAEQRRQLNDLAILTSKLVFFFDGNKDGKRLIWLCQQFVKLRSIIFPLMSRDDTGSVWIHKVRRLMGKCIKHLSIKPSDGQENAASLFRLTELFTTPAVYETFMPLERANAIVLTIFKYQMAQDYFTSVRRICDERIPPLLEETTKAPTPMAESVLDMILRPLAFVTPSNRDHYGARVLQSLTSNFFTRPFSEQVNCFIIPALGASKFPMQEWTYALANATAEAENSSSPWLLYAYLKIGRKIDHASCSEPEQYLSVLAAMTSSMLGTSGGGDAEDADDDAADSDDDDDVDAAAVAAAAAMECETNGPQDVKGIVQRSLFLLNEQEHVSGIVRIIENVSGPFAIRSLCKICHGLLMCGGRLALHNFRLLNFLAFRPHFISRLWQLILASKQPALFGPAVPLLTAIARASALSHAERDDIVPLLAVFAALFGYRLVTIHDTEFYGDDEGDGGGGGGGGAQRAAANVQYMPFSLSELVPMSTALRNVTLGLVELAFPESRPAVSEDYRRAMSVGAAGGGRIHVQTWSHLFRVCVELLRQLYTRDTRRQFCPDNHWISDRFQLNLETSRSVSLRRSRIRQYRPFRGLRMFTREQLEQEGPPLSPKEVRLATVLRELPFALPFNQRVDVFMHLVVSDKQEHQGERVNFMQGPSIHISVRRNFLYEDAFEKLSKENEPDLRHKMRVQLMNFAGLDEAGIDGGGLFREFLSELLKTAFDPNRGFFILTEDQHLYPNPNVRQLHEDFVAHYFFIGRVLGKALYENMLVELPMAGFFLSKLLGQKSANVDIDHLHSLDPELYKNLLSLKNFDGNVRDLGLDFTIMTEAVGESHMVELKPSGAATAVDNDNKLEYILLMADFKLNRQIRQQCAAFRQGLSDVINLDWLRMFSHRELQTLISGAEHDLDLDDLRHHTNYAGGFADDHETIQIFWNTVKELTQSQKRSLLKFVTSCSRAPLLGFRELHPPFCIQNVGDGELDRLPTASTCMNLLKMPGFRDTATLRTKLLYAIESGAGFELS